MRLVLAWSLTALGATALFLGWYGASGTALTAKQIPYVVSGGLTGVCLLVLAAACFAADDVRRSLSRVSELERKLGLLYELLTDPDEPVAGEGELVALSGGGAYHRRSCRLVQGKASVEQVTPAIAASRGLTPCRVCEPPGLRVA
jgi:hypothetical protein